MKNIIRTCKECGETKNLKEFIADRIYKDKKYYKHICRKCFQIKQREYQRLYKKQQYSSTKNKAKIYGQARQKQNLIKKSFCESCGDLDKLHMHHPDYSKPLEVITLCVGCHEKQHHAHSYL